MSFVFLKNSAMSVKGSPLARLLEPGFAGLVHSFGGGHGHFRVTGQADHPAQAFFASGQGGRGSDVFAAPRALADHTGDAPSLLTNPDDGERFPFAAILEERGAFVALQVSSLFSSISLSKCTHDASSLFPWIERSPQRIFLVVFLL